MNDMSNLRRYAFLVLSALAMNGCVTARRAHDVPVPKVPGAWSRSAEPERQIDMDALSRWWTTFDDPVLTSLVERTVVGNFDLRTAVSRVRQARAQANAARADLFPSVAAGASMTASHTGSTGGLPQPSAVQRSYHAGVDLSWEPDFFGGTRSAIDAATATAEARGADLQDVLVTVVAEAAGQYIRIRSLQERVAVAEANQRLQDEAYEIAGFRLQAGLTTDLDVQLARSNVESTGALIASLQLDLAQAFHALATLLGQDPASLDQELTNTVRIPEAPLSVAVGVPADAVRRRFDVRSAERRLAAQAADVDATRAQLYPRFALTGSIGLESLKIASLFVPGASFWRATPSVNWRLFDRRQLQQNLLARTEGETQASIEYEATVLSALREVEDALVAYTQERVRRERLTNASEASQQAADLALQLYNSGLRDFRDVLDAQRSLLTLQDQLAFSRGSVSANLVQLYRALGGGWAALTALPNAPDALQTPADKAIQ